MTIKLNKNTTTFINTNPETKIKTTIVFDHSQKNKFTFKENLVTGANESFLDPISYTNPYCKVQEY